MSCLHLSYVDQNRSRSSKEGQQDIAVGSADVRPETRLGEADSMGEGIADIPSAACTLETAGDRTSYAGVLGCVEVDQGEGACQTEIVIRR